MTTCQYSSADVAELEKLCKGKWVLSTVASRRDPHIILRKVKEELEVDDAPAAEVDLVPRSEVDSRAPAPDLVPRAEVRAAPPPWRKLSEPAPWRPERSRSRSRSMLPRRSRKEIRARHDMRKGERP